MRQSYRRPLVERLVICLWAGLLVTLTGCGELTKQQECNASIEVLNRDPTAAEGNITDAAALEERLKQKDEYAKSIEALPLTDPGLKEHIAAFKKNVDAENQLLRDLVKGSTDFPALQKRDGEIADERGKLVETINTYCGRTPK
jgi:hypothetical protein